MIVLVLMGEREGTSRYSFVKKVERRQGYAGAGERRIIGGRCVSSDTYFDAHDSDRLPANLPAASATAINGW